MKSLFDWQAVIVVLGITAALCIAAIAGIIELLVALLKVMR